MTTTAKTNVYLDGELWCHATWIDGEFDTAGTLEIDVDATEADALAAAKALYAGRVESHDIVRVDDIN